MAKKIWIASIACDKFKIDNWNILYRNMTEIISFLLT